MHLPEPMDLEIDDETTEPLSSEEGFKDWWASYIPQNFVVCGPTTFYAFVWEQTVFLFFGEYHEHYENKWDLTESEEDVQCNPVFGKNGIVNLLVKLFETLENRGIYADFYLEAPRHNPREYATRGKPVLEHQGYIERMDRATGSVNLLFIIKQSLYQRLVKPKIQQAKRTGDLREMEKILEKMNVHYHLADGRYLYPTEEFIQSTQKKLKGEFWPTVEPSNILENVNPYSRIWNIPIEITKTIEKMIAVSDIMKPTELDVVSNVEYSYPVELNFFSKNLAPALKNLGLELIVLLTYLDFSLNNGTQLMETFLDPQIDVLGRFDHFFRIFQKWIKGSARIFFPMQDLSAKNLVTLEGLLKKTKVYVIVKKMFENFKGDCGWEKGEMLSTPKTHHRIAKQIAACVPSVREKIKRHILTNFEPVKSLTLMCLPLIDWSGRLNNLMERFDEVRKFKDVKKSLEIAEITLKGLQTLFDVLKSLEEFLRTLGVPFMDAYLLGRMFANLRIPDFGSKRKTKVSVTYAGAYHVEIYRRFFANSLGSEEICSSFHSVRREKLEESFLSHLEEFIRQSSKADGTYGNQTYEAQIDAKLASKRFWNFSKPAVSPNHDGSRPLWIEEETKRSSKDRTVVSFSTENYRKMMNEIEAGVRYDFGIGGNSKSAMRQESSEKETWFSSLHRCANCQSEEEAFRCEGCRLVGFCSQKCKLESWGCEKCPLCEST